MPFCSYCGKEIAGTESYCPGCGRPLNVVPVANSCPGCGAILNGKPAFCPVCGMKTDNSSSNGYPHNSYGMEVRGESSAILAILMSFFLPGLGIMYGGNFKIGLIVLGVSVAAAILMMFSILFGLVCFVLWIYGMYEAYRLCEENNRLWYKFQDDICGPRL